MREITSEELKEILVEMLVDIDEYCAANNLKYFLAYGTLLGAVRHKGFIPWDDDIDIMMPRQDDERFISSFNSCSRKNYIEVISHQMEKKYYLAYAKVVHKDTMVEEAVRSNYHIGAFIDVFPIDNLSNELETARKEFDSISLYRNILNIKNMTTRKGRSIIKNLVVILGNVLLMPFPKSYFITAIDKRAKKNEGIKEPKFLANIVLGVYGEKEIMPTEWLRTEIKVDFEGRKFNIPENYDLILSQLYGDYMVLPPIEKRITHHGIKAWWK